MIDKDKCSEYAQAISAGITAAARKIDGETASINPRHPERNKETPSVVSGKVRITDVKGHVFNMKMTGIWPEFIVEVYYDGKHLGVYKSLGEMPDVDELQAGIFNDDEPNL